THRAAVEFLWIGGQQLDISSEACPDIDIESFPGLPEKVLIWWECNMLWSLSQYENPSKLLNIWDIVAALLAFKQSAPEYVEHILLKWLTSYFGSQFGNSTTLLSEAFKFLPKLSSRQLHLINIISRHVVLKESTPDHISSKQQELKGLSVTKEQVNLWMELLLSSENELLERLVGFSFSTILSLLSNSSVDSFEVGCGSLDGLRQMEQWVSHNEKNVKDQTKFLAAKVGKVEKSNAAEKWIFKQGSGAQWALVAARQQGWEDQLFFMKVVLYGYIPVRQLVSSAASYVSMDFAVQQMADSLEQRDWREERRGHAPQPHVIFM
ncbi:UNVERIFIED_CONTAM: hypothetical protein Sindi_2047500, partial [Sesamum indicum]